MSEENKNIENNENEEVVENTQEETVEEVVENTADEAVEEVAEETAEEAVENTAEEMIEQANLIEKKSENGNKNIIIAIVSVIVVIALAAGIFFMNKAGVFETNKYNKMGYINISGRTLEEVAQESGMTIDEFKTEYLLPEDMTGDTYESAAFYNIPTKKIAEMYGMTFDEVVSFLALPETITEDTPWGEAEGEAPLKNYVGEENVDSFKQEYNLGEEITGDTKWKEIRSIVDQAALDARLEAEKEAEKAGDTEDDASDVEGAANGDVQELSEEELQALLESAAQQAPAETADAAATQAPATQAPAAN